MKKFFSFIFSFLFACQFSHNNNIEPLPLKDIPSLNFEIQEPYILPNPKYDFKNFFSPPFHKNYFWDFQLIFNDNISYWYDFFKKTERFYYCFERGRAYIPHFKEIFSKYNLPSGLSFLPFIESCFSCEAVSKAKAVGMWQFIYSTAKIYGLKTDFFIDERKDPFKSADAAAKYLKYLYEIFGDWNLALASYNAGPKRIKMALTKDNTISFWDLKSIKKETKNYVFQFYASLFWIKDELNRNPVMVPLSFVSIPLPGNINIKFLCYQNNIPFDSVKSLNPELLIDITPVYAESYQLKIPPSYLKDFEFVLKNDLSLFYAFKKYIVSPGDTLYKLSKITNSSVSFISKLNDISNPSAIYVGQVLYLPKSKLENLSYLMIK